MDYQHLNLDLNLLPLAKALNQNLKAHHTQTLQSNFICASDFFFKLKLYNVHHMILI
jgi:hypothetical protein